MARPLPVADGVHVEEGADPVLGVELPEDAVVVPAVQVEGPEHVPACNTQLSLSLPHEQWANWGSHLLSAPCIPPLWTGLPSHLPGC